MRLVEFYGNYEGREITRRPRVAVSHLSLFPYAFLKTTQAPATHATASPVPELSLPHALYNKMSLQIMCSGPDGVATSLRHSNRDARAISDWRISSEKFRIFYEDFQQNVTSFSGISICISTLTYLWKASGFPLPLTINDRAPMEPGMMPNSPWRAETCRWRENLRN